MPSVVVYCCLHIAEQLRSHVRSILRLSTYKTSTRLGPGGLGSDTNASQDGNIPRWIPPKATFHVPHSTATCKKQAGCTGQPLRYFRVLSCNFYSSTTNLLSAFFVIFGPFFSPFSGDLLQLHSWRLCSRRSCPFPSDSARGCFGTDRPREGGLSRALTARPPPTPSAPSSDSPQLQRRPPSPAPAKTSRRSSTARPGSRSGQREARTPARAGPGRAEPNQAGPNQAPDELQRPRPSAHALTSHQSQPPRLMQSISRLAFSRRPITG